MTSPRLYAAGPLAGVATAALFYAMNGLVGSDGDIVLDAPEQRRIIDFTQEPFEPEVLKTQWDVEKLETVEPPKTDKPKTTIDTGDGGIGVISVPPAPATPAPPTGPTFGHAEGQQLPLVVVQPTYPRRCAERGIEGYVVVELTVAADGSVPTDSIEVVAAEPVGCFERSAIKAAAKFKYKPLVVDGVAKAATGIRYQFTYALAE